jgi:N-acetylmuramoyl-L-alanine amidase
MQAKLGSRLAERESVQLRHRRCGLREILGAILSPRVDSGILMAVRRGYFLLLFVLTVVSVQTLQAVPALQEVVPSQTPQQPTPQPTQQPAQPTQPPAAPQPSQQPAQQAPEHATPPAVPPHNALTVVVLDPAHGGADQGARGSSGIAESDIVLSFARLLRISLEAQGLRVLLTRQANDGPSFDDRSKTANAQRGAIFITLHVSSTGPAGIVRVYSLPQDGGPAVRATASPSRTGLVRWDRAQQGYLELSRKLAELIQIQMAQRFRGSAETPTVAAVRQLRTIAAPAVAIEVSSVSLPDRAPLDRMAPVLAEGVARAVAAFRLVYEAGAK